MIPDAPDGRRELFRGINILMRSGAGNLSHPFPYTEEEMMRDRGTFWQSIKRIRLGRPTRG